LTYTKNNNTKKRGSLQKQEADEQVLSALAGDDFERKE